LFKPRRILEIGSGQSTRLARLAIARNDAESGEPTRHVLVEPYEHPWLDDIKGVEVLRSRIEDLDASVINELASGDALFIDSSHMIRPQGDVLKLYLEVLPSLPAGVIVHIHDIFTPRDYLTEWLRDDVRFWNEQYLVEALLSNSARYEILLALNFLMHEHFEQLREAAPYLTTDREPGSLYLRIRG
jgi:hypothetical protein